MDNNNGVCIGDDSNDNDINDDTIMTVRKQLQ